MQLIYSYLQFKKMSFEYHMEITFACHDDNDYDTDERFDLEDEYREKFRCLPNNMKELPCNATDAHGVDRGLCFTFVTPEDVKHAHAHILESEWFARFLKNNPKYYFKVAELDDIRGLNDKAIACSIDGVVDMNSEWNQFIKNAKGLDDDYFPYK